MTNGSSQDRCPSLPGNTVVAPVTFSKQAEAAGMLQERLGARLKVFCTANAQLPETQSSLRSGPPGTELPKLSAGASRGGRDLAGARQA